MSEVVNITVEDGEDSDKLLVVCTVINCNDGVNTGVMLNKPDIENDMFRAAARQTMHLIYITLKETRHINLKPPPQ